MMARLLFAATFDSHISISITFSCAYVTLALLWMVVFRLQQRPLPLRPSTLFVYLQIVAP